MRKIFAVAAILIIFSSDALCISNSFRIKEPYTFVVIGDNRSGDSIYKEIAELIVSHHPAFVVNTGDLIAKPGDRSQWKNFWEISKLFSVPYFLVIGNHDVTDKKSEAVWKEEVDLPGNELYYSWVSNDSLFVVLNSCEPDNDRKITGDQLAWLKRTLNPQKYKHQFVFLHHPLYIEEGGRHYGRSMDMYPKLRDELQALLNERKVIAVFAGHEHTYYKKKVDDVWHIITGGAGAPLYRGGFYHFVIVTVDREKIYLKVIDKEKKIRDEFFLR